MADDVTVDHGDEGQLGDPAVAVSESVEQTCFWRLRAVVSRERADDHASDDLYVVGKLLAHDHRGILA
jgi:hypothetical protein